jgi:hypothetical protein
LVLVSDLRCLSAAEKDRQRNSDQEKDDQNREIHGYDRLSGRSKPKLDVALKLRAVLDEPKQRE